MKKNMSFVVAARNDNYGGDFLHRMQIFLNVLLTLWDRHGLNAELVIVEWNPPEDSPRLLDALSWPKEKNADTIRFIEVPREMHLSIPNSERMPMFEYIAKNVGIRRAAGKYVLATNPDILFSDELIRCFVSGELSQESFYRVDRYDVGEKVPIGMSVEEQLSFCRKHLVSVATIDGRAKPGRLYSLKRFLKETLSNSGHPPRGVDSGIIRDISDLHTGASGDFFLMARNHWHKLRGYPEFKSHSYVDGYMCCMAASLGLSQIVHKSPIYHQEHDRSDHDKRPLTDYEEYVAAGHMMLKSQTPEIFNDEDWGLGSEKLAEKWVGA